MEPTKTSLTIEEAGERAKQKWPDDYKGLSPSQAGQKFLDANPHNWEYISDGVVAEHISNLKHTKYIEASGLWAFFGKMGEKQRAAYFEQRSKTAKSLVELEQYSASVHDITLQSKLKIATTAQAIAAAKFQIHKLGLDAGRAEAAAEKGHSLATHDALNLEAGQAVVRKGLDQHTHELVVKDKTVDSSLRIREAQSNHILVKEIEELRQQLTGLLKTQEHSHVKEIEELKHSLRLKEKEFDHKAKQDEINREIEGTIKLANTSELSRAQQIQMLIDYGRKMESAASDFERGIFKREVDRLTKELYADEQQSGMASKKNVGQEPEGGSTPPQSGSSPSGAPESAVERPPDTHLGHVN